MKQTIEVEVRNGAEEGEYVVVWPSGCTDDCGDDELRQLGLTAPAPERTEYPLQRITESQFNARISIHDFDEVLVAAHSVRVGDRVEWAPGDWREITQVEDHRLAITIWFDDEPFTLNRWGLVAVRR